MASEKSASSTSLRNQELLSYSELHNDAGARSSSRNDPRQIKTDAALEGALLLLLAEKPLDQITVLEICAAAGIHKTTFFRRHAGKDALLDHVAAHQIEMLVRLALPAGNNIDGMRVLCEYVQDHRELWKALLTGGAGGTMREELLRVSLALAGQSGGPEWLPLELVTRWTVTLIVEAMAWWLSEPDGAHSIEHMAAILERGIRSLRT